MIVTDLERISQKANNRLIQRRRSLRRQRAPGRLRTFSFDVYHLIIIAHVDSKCVESRTLASMIIAASVHIKIDALPPVQYRLLVIRVQVVYRGAAGWRGRLKQPVSLEQQNCLGHRQDRRT